MEETVLIVLCTSFVAAQASALRPLPSAQHRRIIFVDVYDAPVFAAELKLSVSDLKVRDDHLAFEKLACIFHRQLALHSSTHHWLRCQW